MNTNSNSGSSKNATVRGNFIYEKILSLIDYCGDIARNSADGNTGYDQYFSPNNIRRLIISPDGAMVYYHISTPKNQLRKYIQFNSKMVGAIQYREDYVPMTNVLTADRVCASIEEVIIVPNSDDGSVSLTSRELDFTSMIKGYNSSKGGDIEELIKSRYKRLYSFVIYTGNMREFTAQLSSIKDNSYVLLSNMEFMQNSQIHHFHKDDWYVGYGSTANFYSLDASGSPLNSHFIKVKETIDDAKKKNAVEASRSKRVGGILQEQEDEIEKFTKLCGVCKRLNNLRNNGVNALNAVDELKVSAPTLSVHKNWKDFSPNSTNIILLQANPSFSEENVCANNIKAIKQAYSQTYANIAGMLIKNIDSLFATRPITAKVIFNYVREHNFKIPPTAEITSMVSRIRDKSGEDFNDRGKPDDSIATVCFLYCKLFLATDGEKSVTKVMDKNYWLEVLK